MRWLFIFAGIFVVLILGSVGGGIYALKKFHGDFMETAQGSLEKAAGLPVVIKDIQTGGFTGEAEINELVLLGKRSDHKPLITFKKVKVKVDPKSMIFGVLVIESMSAESVGINIEGSNYGLKEIVSSLDAAGKDLEALKGGPVVIIKSVSLPAGKFTVGGEAFGRPVQASHEFGELRLAALGENSDGAPLPKLLQQILAKFTQNALGVPDFKGILR